MSDPIVGLVADIRVNDLARHFGLDPADLRTTLSEKLRPRQVPGLYLYDEGYSFRTQEEIEQFLGKLKGGGGEAGAAGWVRPEGTHGE